MAVKKLFSLRERYKPYNERLSAVGLWTFFSLQEGAWPRKTWGDLHDRIEETANNVKLDDKSNLDTNWHKFGGILMDGHWKLSRGNWKQRFMSIIAAPGTPGMQGASAKAAITDTRTASTRVRVITFKRIDPNNREEVREILAAISTDRTMYLFDPRHGLYAIRKEDDPIQWFERQMSRHYGSAQHISEFVTHIVKVSDIFYTWFGPPAGARDDGTRPDIMGPVDMAHAQFPRGFNKPRIKFCCLNQYRDQFRRELPANVEIVAMEEQFPNQLRSDARLKNPDFNALDVCVETILSHSTEDISNIRALVNAKTYGHSTVSTSMAAITWIPVSLQLVMRHLNM